MFPTRRITTLGGDVYRDQYSLEFDGTDDYVEMGNASDLNVTTGDFTIMAWVYITGYIAGPRVILSKDSNIGGSNSGYGFTYEGSKARLIVEGATAQRATVGATTLVYNKWYHMVGTFDYDGAAYLYLNGVQDATSSTATGDINTTDPFRIGWDAVASRQLTGNISEASFWNIALSSSQVKQLYNGREPFDARNVAKSNLKGYWRMGDGVLDHRQTNGLVADQVTATLGSELITAQADRDFSSASNWTNNNIASYDEDGDLSLTGVNGQWAFLTDTVLPLSTATVYKLTYTATIASGTWKFQGYNNPHEIGAIVAGTANVLYFSNVEGAGGLRATCTGDGTIHLDDISVKEVNGNAGVLVNFDGTDFKTDVPR